MTVTSILVGLAVWTAISIVVGAFVGAVMGHCAADDVAVPQPDQRPLRKSA
jgi:hypothetical protein